MALTFNYAALFALVALAFVLLSANSVSADSKGDKIIIMPNKHHGYHHKFIPIPIYYPMHQEHTYSHSYGHGDSHGYGHMGGGHYDMGGHGYY